MQQSDNRTITGRQTEKETETNIHTVALPLKHYNFFYQNVKVYSKTNYKDISRHIKTAHKTFSCLVINEASSI